MEARIKEIEAMSWREIKTLATNLGISKTDDQQWEDLAPAIAEKEAQQEPGFNISISIPEGVDPQEIPEKLSEPIQTLIAQEIGQSKGTNFDYTTSNGSLICPVCNQPARTGRYKQPVCPLPKEHPTCPRTQEAS